MTGVRALYMTMCTTTSAEGCGVGQPVSSDILNALSTLLVPTRVFHSSNTPLRRAHAARRKASRSLASGTCWARSCCEDHSVHGPSQRCERGADGGERARGQQARKNGRGRAPRRGTIL